MTILTAVLSWQAVSRRRDLAQEVSRTRMLTDSLHRERQMLTGTMEIVKRVVQLPDSSQRPILWYGIDPSCGLCGRNAGLLNELSRRYPEQVLGVINPRAAQLTRFLEEYGFDIPLVPRANALGAILIPASVSPVGVVTVGATFDTMLFGVLGEPERAYLEAVLGQ